MPTGPNPTLRAAAVLMDETKSAARAIAEVGETLIGAHANQHGLGRATLDVLLVVTSKAANRELRSLADAVSWAATLPGGLPLVRLLTAIDPADDNIVDAFVMLHVTRALADQALHPGGTAAAATDAAVESLDRILVQDWKHQQAKQPHEWLYHPRKTLLSHLVVKRFLVDMLTVSGPLRRDAAAGLVACDLNVTMISGQRHKKLDLVIGRPLAIIGDAGDPGNPLRKAKIATPLMTLEVKACMTSHRQATPRLLDELRSSVEVVKATEPTTIPIAIVVINVSPTFTNPLNLPGPNEHTARDIERLFLRLIERVTLDRGSGTEIAYGGLAVVVVDTDNERRIQEGARAGRVPATHTYERTIGRAARLYEQSLVRIL